MTMRQFLIILLYISCITFNRFAEEIKNLKVSGGLLYKSWVESDTSMIGGITIETPANTTNDRNPLQVLLLVDVSQSMMGEALQNAKKSALTVVKHLMDKDIFGLITYSGYGKVLIPMQPLNSNNRNSVIRDISRLKHENKRNLSEGLKKTFEQFERYKGQRSLGKYIFLLTNGNANDGVTETSQLLTMAESFSHQNKVSFSTFGYNRNFDSEFLISLAQQTWGHAYYIDESNVQNMSDYFQKEITRINDISVQNLYIEIKTPSVSSIKNVNGGVLTDEGTIFVGNFQANIKKNVVFEIAGRPDRRKELLINIRYIEPKRLTKRKTRVYIDIPVSTGKPSYDRNYGPVLIEYTTKRDLAEKITIIKEKKGRIAYVKQVNEKILLLENDNNSINSDHISDFIQRLNQIKNDLANGAIESELLMKRLKYDFVALTYASTDFQVKE